MTDSLITEAQVQQLDRDLEPFHQAEHSIYVANQRFMVPKKPYRLAVGLVMYQGGLESLRSQYMALVVLPGWLGFYDADGVKEYLPFDEITRIRRENMGNVTVFVPDPDGNPRPVTRRDAAGISLEITREDNFTDEVRFATRKSYQADQWHSLLSNARRAFERGETLAGDIQI
jgi:hypothetical protein